MLAENVPADRQQANREADRPRGDRSGRQADVEVGTGRQGMRGKVRPTGVIGRDRPTSRDRGSGMPVCHSSHDERLKGKMDGGFTTKGGKARICRE